MSDTLVLDQSYQPIGVVTWERAITLLWDGKVQVLHEYEDRIVRSTTVEIPVPSVIRFLRVVRSRKKAVKFSRENLILRDKGTCQYCGSKVERKNSTYDHVTPRVQGGTTRWENIVIACTACNQKKGGRTPQQAGMKLRATPVRPKNLPDAGHYILEWRTGMPDQWRGWLRDQVVSVDYWHGELESD